MTRLKDITFESASAITGTDAFNTTQNTAPTLDTTSQIKGTKSAKFAYTNTQSTGVASGFNTPEIFVSAYIKFPTLPSSSVRFINISNGSSQAGIYVQSTNKWQVRWGPTTLLSFTGAAAVAGTIYRVGIRAKVATDIANADAQMDVWVATGDAPFDSSNLIYSGTNITMATSAANFTSISLGNTNSSTSTHAGWYMDDIRIDDTTMPLQSTANTAVNPTVTVSTVESVKRGIANTFSNIVTGVISVAQDVVHNGNNIAKEVTVTVGKTLSLLKSIGKPITYTETPVETVQKNVGKPTSVISNVVETVNNARAITIIYASNVIESVSKTYAKIISYVETPAIIAGRGFARLVTYTSTIIPAFGKGTVTLKNITLTVGKTLGFTKNVGKPASTTVTTVLTRNTIIPKLIQVAVIPVISIGKAFSKIITRAVATSPVVIYGKYFFINASVAVGKSLTIIKNIVKPFSITEATNIPTALKRIGKSTSTSTGINVISGKGYLKLITVVKNVAVNYQRAIAKPISITVTPITTVRKSLTLLIALTVTTLQDARKTFPMLISTVVGVVESVISGRGYLRTVIRTIPVNVQLLPKQIEKVLAIISNTNTAVIKGFDFIIEVTVNTIESFAKLASTVLGTTPFKRSVRTLVLDFKNSTLSAFGKNTRTLTLKDTDNDSI